MANEDEGSKSGQQQLEGKRRFSIVGCAKFVFAHAETKEINTNGK